VGGGGSEQREAILIVDDDPSVRVAIAMMLSDAGYITREAETGRDALRAARLSPPALVLLDVNIPGLCGYEVCRLLREEFGEHLPIVFVSGERTATFDRVAGLLIGANDYVVKPFAEDELLARVQALLGRRHAPSTRVASCLTARELEILRLLSAGLAPDEIAQRLVISPKTVGAHIEHVYLKLGVQTRAQAVAAAYRGQLVDTGTPLVAESGVAPLR
jgi:DNA-binding NarL/FixJ family response regulator